LKRLINLFFTTKPEEKGTGLGLTISHAIIEKHGGILKVGSELDVETTIIIDLPIREY
jgi:two-component system, NtrC family, sensor kinase